MTINTTTSSLSRFPNYFWQSLKESNQAKDAEAPVAVALQAEEDHNGAITCPAAQSFLLQIAKIYRVVISEIQTSSEIRTRVQHIVKQTGQRPNLLIFNAHGCFKSMRLKGENEYSLSSVCEEDFSNLAFDAKIFLLSCSTGSQDYSECLAQRIANISKRVVYAPAFNISSSETRAIPLNSREVKILSYRDGKDQHIYQFSTGQPAQLNNEDISWLCEKAEQGDPEAQYMLGHCYEYGWGNLQKSETKAVVWYRKAADQGHPEAQYALAKCYQYWPHGPPKSAIEFVAWYRKSADQNHSKAQYELAQCYKNGLCGLQQSETEALAWYRKSADQNNSQAQYELALLHERGFEGTPSKQEATAWMRQAANNGHPEAAKWIKQHDSLFGQVQSSVHTALYGLARWSACMLSKIIPPISILSGEV